MAFTGLTNGTSSRIPNCASMPPASTVDRILQRSLRRQVRDERKAGKTDEADDKHHAGSGRDLQRTVSRAARLRGVGAVSRRDEKNPSPGHCRLLGKLGRDASQAVISPVGGGLAVGETASRDMGLTTDTSRPGKQMLRIKDNRRRFDYPQADLQRSGGGRPVSHLPGVHTGSRAGYGTVRTASGSVWPVRPGVGRLKGFTCPLRSVNKELNCNFARRLPLPAALRPRRVDRRCKPSCESLLGQRYRCDAVLSRTHCRPAVKKEFTFGGIFEVAKVVRVLYDMYEQVGFQ